VPITCDIDEEPGLWERTRIPGLLRALWFGASQLIRRGCPARIDPPPGAPGEHRLMLREDGSVRCTACMLCVAACPAGCIEVELDESLPPDAERRPKEFRIDLLACTLCGRCVEVCPCDAIRMDTGKLPPPVRSRDGLIYDMRKLASNHPEGASPLSRAL